MATLAVVLASLVLRLVAATERSLWLDELHTLHHTDARTLPELLRGLEPDNHPPLAFVLVRASRGLAGDGELALRLPAVLAGIGAVLLTALAALRLGGARAALFAALVAGFSGLALQTQSEARMYALAALAVAGVLEGLAARAAGRTPSVPWRVAAWTAVGLLSHYWFLHHLALFAAAALAVRAWRGVPRLTVRDLAPFALGALVAAPWYATGFLAQLTGHELAPGGRDPSLARLAQSYLVLVLYQIGRLPRPLTLALAGVGAAVLAAGLCGTVGLLRAREPERARLGACLLGTAFLLGPLGYVVGLVFPRAGFNWTYLAGAVPALAISVGLAAARLRPRVHGVLAGALGGALLVGAVPLAAGPGTEDLRGAVRSVLREAGPSDGVLAVEWQPGFFPHGRAWTHYTRDVPAAELPRRLEHGPQYQLTNQVSELPERLFVVRRGLPLDAPLLSRLEGLYRERTSTGHGWGVSVERFSGLRSRER